MSKKLRDESIYLAPQIIGYRDEDKNPIVIDERNNANLNPYNVGDKILIYKRQVKEWFLNRAQCLSNSKENDFVVVMISTSYIEGVEQYRKGISSNGNSKNLFVSGIKRIFCISNMTDQQCNTLYKHLRCGLFHNGMSGNAVILNRELENAISFYNNDTIKINPNLFLDAVARDFNEYIYKLKDEHNMELRNNFNQMFCVV